MVTGEALITEARQYLGTPWYHHGRDHEGLDCLGLILVPAWNLDLTDYQPPNYSPEFSREMLTEALESLCERVWKWEGDYSVEPPDVPWGRLVKPGDILLMEVRGHPSHLAYWAGEGQIIQAHMRAGVIERGLDRLSARSVVGVYRWKELTC